MDARTGSTGRQRTTEPPERPQPTTAAGPTGNTSPQATSAPTSSGKSPGATGHTETSSSQVVTAPAGGRKTPTAASPARTTKPAAEVTAPAEDTKPYTRTDPPDPAPTTAAGSVGIAEVAGWVPPSAEFLTKVALVTAAVTAVGSLLALGRNQALSYLFGAGSETDAFLVAWTVPEFAATLFIEDGLAFVLVPLFSMAVTRRAQGASDDPVRSLVGTLRSLSQAFLAAAALLIVGAPYLVKALAPGLPDTGLAVDCTRLTATCVLTFGLAGYCSATLRSHGRFLAPAAVYMAYNSGIIAAMFLLSGRWGVRSAAIGVAVGGGLMALIQLPYALRQLRCRATELTLQEAVPERPLDLTLIATVLLFPLCRQSQVLIERFLGSTLPVGSVSYLDYAQKVVQIPMTFSLVLCTVTFPVVAQALAEGDTERARSRVEKDVALVACVVLLGTAVIVACAPQIVELLFQRGAFTGQDTMATASVLRVYALGLLGHALTGALVHAYFSTRRPSWYPLAAMAAGLVTTSWIGAAAVGTWGVLGIAAASAAGITVTALLLLRGISGRGVPVHVREVVAELSRPMRAALVAGVVGWFCAGRVESPVHGLAIGSALVTVVFVLLARALGVVGLTTALGSVTRRPPHVGCR